ncbi:MAG: FAD-binding protein [Anaerolineae bacterium]|nr:FAD-binding protein [Anaerolineae bacterium]
MGVAAAQRSFVIREKDTCALEAIVGPTNVSTRSADLDAHSIDESHSPSGRADVIVWPTTTEQVSALLAWAQERRVPVVPWSAGSSLEGNPVPIYGGLLLAMYRMNRVLDIRERDLQVVVQPGVVYADLNKELGRLGMFFPPAPGSSEVATIGGMVSNNSSGMRAVKYGVTRDYVLGLEVVLAGGQVIRVGSHATKTSSGYDLVDLFVGSEGTLGVVTEVTMRVVGLPERVMCVTSSFPSLQGATNAVYETLRCGLDPAAIEILDAETMRITNEQQGLSLPNVPTLFVEFHGSNDGMYEEVDYLREICEECGAIRFDMAEHTEAREALWRARREARESIKRSHPGMTLIGGDACVPMSRFGELVAYVHELVRASGVRIYAFGHAGDGNLHTEAIVDGSDSDAFALGEDLTAKIIRRALEMGGTATGEHGVGLMKRPFMRQEHGAALDIMRSIKTTLDPYGIMNPGKIFPDE